MLNNKVGTVFESVNIVGVAPSQRLHLVLLGVDDVQRSANFYEALGWRRSPTGHAGFEKFDLGGYALSLIAKADLAKDAGYIATPAQSFSGIALVYLAKAAKEVPAILAKAVAAGGTLVKPATRTHWGIAGYFKDPDGHLFEVDYEEAWVFDSEHKLVVDCMN